MTVTLSVHDVREHIRRAGSSGISRPGPSSNAPLGRIFHEVAADLVSADPGENAFSLFENLDFRREVWLSHLVSQTYEKLVGPRLARDQARLHEASEEVLHLWGAVQSLCGWLVDLAWEAVNPTGRKRAFSWDELRMALRAEVPLEVNLRVPGWSESVRLTGVADSLLRLPRTGSWCVQEYKLGRASPEADLAQVCLYHLILLQAIPQRKRAGSRARNRALALMSFQPEMKERVFGEKEVATAQEKL
ncbi:MAG: PD-(D/E)XK nuclease family protein, partial [Deltaproteobacteria bacterium]|nr:PD-(D/E)XK nuclease family protein [Deltaproteobacteria bacterium]